MKTRRFFFALALLASLASPAALAQAPKRNLPRPGFNLFSKEQDIELGREFARQVEQQYVVVQNRELTDYVNRVGMRLVEKGGLERYPFYFKVVQEDSINAFALPGGPMYVHTGLLRAVENEAQLAGVLAHELSHVVLRHGTNQASKAQFAQLGALLAGGVVGGGALPATPKATPTCSAPIRWRKPATTRWRWRASLSALKLNARARRPSSWRSSRHLTQIPATA